MVAHILRLKATLLANGLRRSPWQIVGMVFGLLYGLLVLLLLVAGMVALSVGDRELRASVPVLVGAVMVFAWWVVPLIAFGVDSTVDPARFVTFAVPRRSLLVGIALAGLVGVPGAMTAISSVALGAVWWRDPLALVVGLLTAVLGLALAVVGSRATTTAALPLVGRRRVREAMAALAVVPLLLVGPLMSRFSSGVTATPEDLARIADVLAWTPFGAPWAVPADVAAREWGLAAGHAGVAIGALVLVGVVWAKSLEYGLVHPPHNEVSGKRRGLGWFDRLPPTPVGAVTARCLTYWVRDPRYALAAAIVPITPLVLWVIDRDGGALLLAAPIAGFLLGWGISADVAYDGSAFWTHVASPVSGRADRWGRVLAAGAIGLVTVLVFAIGSALVTDRAADIVPLLGVSLGVLLTGLGMASIVSAYVVYPVQQPGESPFETRQGASSAALFSQLLGWLVLIIVSLPEIVLAIVAMRSGSAILGATTLLVGVGLGMTVLISGVRYGGQALERNGPVLLQRIIAFN
jgi:ABC-2 type transport system permease protein